MVYLNEDREIFLDAISHASTRYHIMPVVAEKDYYVTMILRELASRLPYVVFKGGTSLSKCHKAIKRFSEDIDITIDTKISRSQKRELRDNIKEIAEGLKLKIPNIEEIQSGMDYNQYKLEYQSVLKETEDAVLAEVILETSFTEISFPTEQKLVYSYIGEMMMEEAPEALEDYLLEPFPMKVQSINRTLVDKVFAICDYYMEEKTERHSRHIYDIYKLWGHIPKNDDFKNLVKAVRAARSQKSICRSAQPGISISKLLKDISDNDVYKSDYENLTLRILEENVPYSEAVQVLREIIDSGVFEG